jgi:hypothetical protein
MTVVITGIVVSAGTGVVVVTGGSVGEISVTGIVADTVVVAGVGSPSMAGAVPPVWIQASPIAIMSNPKNNAAIEPFIYSVLSVLE